MDEPTSGLDPLMEVIFQECMAEIKKAGKTVLLSSHILSEVETLCDQVSIIRQADCRIWNFIPTSASYPYHR
ncbi:ATP-binding cassette domain-containing protein [Methanosarcina horonobensis]|uniref:hypothetical protein n=1 Tax=Methanosarcina horonobensis TaxID=418008 RepID=UPI0022B8E814|nr:hypothetical protein [Methanosarcina horonobensis]